MYEACIYALLYVDILHNDDDHHIDMKMNKL